jgi:hypothetical protein
MARKYRYYYKVGIKEKTQPVLAELASALGFYNDVPGAAHGLPSPANLFDTLAERFTADPTAVAECLRRVGVVGDGPPGGGPPTEA